MDTNAKQNFTNITFLMGGNVFSFNFAMLRKSNMKIVINMFRGNNITKGLISIILLEFLQISK